MEIEAPEDVLRWWLCLFAVAISTVDSLPPKMWFTNPICSMYGIFTYIYPKNQPNVGKYSIHAASGIGNPLRLGESTGDYWGNLWETCILFAEHRGKYEQYINISETFFRRMVTLLVKTTTIKRSLRRTLGIEASESLEPLDVHVKWECYCKIYPPVK